MAVSAADLIGGHLALDYVNTVDWRDDPTRRKDRLATFEDLLAWARAARLLGAAEARALAIAVRHDAPRAMRSLRRARLLREVLARVLMASGSSTRPAARDIRLLNAFL